MPETIFIHCQTFSRKPNAAGQCVAQVIGEGLRTGGYHPHVADPKPPVTLYGDPAGFQRLHDDHVAQRHTTVTTGSTSRTRAIRRDRHTLFTVVASYPVPTSVVEASADEMARCDKWVDRTIVWVRGQYGDQLKAAFGHRDERYPHLHCWLLPDDPGADATVLHPGKVAKREAEHRLKSEGNPAREAVKAGQQALKTAMRAWIDDYHLHVGAPLGLQRDGPQRRRLSRAQFRAEEAMASHHRRLEEQRAQLQGEIAELQEKSVHIVAKQREIEAMGRAVMEGMQRHRQRMRAEADHVDALGPMLDALVMELEQRTIRFDPTSGWRVRDPVPFRAAGPVWDRIKPAVRRLVEMVQAAEDGTWNAEAFAQNTPAPKPKSLTPDDVCP